MKQAVTHNAGRLSLAYLCLLAVVFLQACAVLMPRERTFPGFVAVITDRHDTFTSLAAEYLNDPSKGWLISEFNDLEALAPGQELIIPLTPQPRELVTPKGYQTVPIIAYHNFSRTSNARMTVSAVAFDAQMKYLKDHGFHVISLETFFAFLNNTNRIPRKSIVITIDDGWRGTYEVAYPILKKYGYPATLFLYTDLITGSRKTLSWAQTREMQANGIDIQNHTKSHRNLAAAKAGESFAEYFAALEDELTLSAQKIKKKLGVEVRYLAYPYGETTPLVIALLQKLGYRGAFTVTRGSNSFFVDRYRIARSVIYGDMDMAAFADNLTTRSRRALQQ